MSHETDTPTAEESSVAQTDTPQNTCPHCGADSQGLSFSGKNTVYCCGAIIGKTQDEQSRLCIERESRQKAEAEVRQLNSVLENTRESRADIIEYRNLFAAQDNSKKLEREFNASQAEVERLQSQLKRAVEIADRYQQVNSRHYQCMCRTCRMLSELKKELK
jgi:hypothetical protein